MYINAIGSVIPQETSDKESFLSKIVYPELACFQCIEPDYKTLIHPRELRRMSRIVKMGMYAAQLCLNEAKVTMPDAIIVGTGLGCMEDTERFLSTIYESDEGLIPPTQFIQSTHNTISSTIALTLECYHYNFTYVHRSISFESAVMDAMMTATELGSANILVGGIDELTEIYLDMTSKMGLWRQNSSRFSNEDASHQQANLPGEGAVFFMLGTEKTANAYASIRAIRTLHQHADEDISEAIEAFLQHNQLSLEDIDLISLGLNGHQKKDAIYLELQHGLFRQKNLIHFKHLCGEYKTASSFAVWLAAKVLQMQVVPDIVKYQPFSVSTINRVLVYNYYGDNHSLFIIEKAI